MASDQRQVTPTSSAVKSQPVNKQNDATIPLEAAELKKANKDIEGRMDQIENMMKSQDQTLQQLTQLMAQLANGGNKDNE